MIQALPISKAAAVRLVRDDFEHGRFSMSPPNVPAVLWREAGRQVAHEAHVELEVRTDRHTGNVLMRANHGLPLNVARWSDEHREWIRNHPGWLVDQRCWMDTMPGRGC